MAELLTAEERAICHELGHISNRIMAIIGHDEPRAGDVREVAGHVHALQNMILSNAAARAYPLEFRLLGEVGSYIPAAADGATEDGATDG